MGEGIILSATSYLPFTRLAPQHIIDPSPESPKPTVFILHDFFTCGFSPLNLSVCCNFFSKYNQSFMLSVQSVLSGTSSFRGTHQRLMCGSVGFSPPSGKETVRCVCGILPLYKGMNSGDVKSDFNRLGEVEIISNGRFYEEREFPMASFQITATIFNRRRLSFL